MSTWICPDHQQVKFVPPGVSNKTGKAYTGFFCCPVKGCEQRPPKEPGNVQRSQPPVRAAGPAPSKPQPAPDWSRIAEGKCRSLAISAWIQAGKELDGFWEVEKDIIRYMMTGSTPFDERWEPVDEPPFPEA